MILEIKLHIRNELPLEEIEEISQIDDNELTRRLEEMKSEFIKYFKREGIEEDSAFKEVAINIIR